MRRSLIRTFAAAFLLLPLTLLGGCDVLTGNDDDDDDGVEGTWTLTDGDETVVLQITSTQVIVYVTDVDIDCYGSNVLDIVSVSDDTYTLSDASDTGTIQVIFRRVGDNLELTDLNSSTTQTDIFTPFTGNVSTFDLCMGGGFGDTTTACTQLPQLTVGSSQVGELTTTDPQAAEGAHYDTWGLQITSATTVQIDQMSDEIDSYLFLYEDDGSFIAFDDDGGEGLDSRITIDLDAACYRVEATTFDPGETGGYTLSVSAN